MKSLRILLHMARADFLERARSTGFLFTLAIAIYGAHAFLPPNGSSYVTLQLGGHRGIYDSAWVGALVALLASTFLSLVGFYLVKNAVSRDRDTRVGEILAGTPLRKPLYTVGKTLSNFMVLAAMTCVMALAAGLVQVVRGEDVHVRPWALLAPFVILTLPTMLVTAAIAVFFETIPVLRGGVGNVAYFFLWVFLMVGGGASRESLGRPANDWMGRGVVMPDIVEAVQTAYPDFQPDSSSITMGLTFRDRGWTLTTFRWKGIRWTPAAIGGRLLWVVVGLLLGALAAVPFDRFDPSRRTRRERAPPASRPARGIRIGRKKERPAPPGAGGSIPSVDRLPSPHVRPASVVSKFTTLLHAELRLVLRGQRRAWFIVLAGLMLASLLVPLPIARSRLLPFLWVWPILMWSPMGTREGRHRTDQILFSAPHPIAVQLAAVWAAGFVLALGTGAIVAIRLALTGDMAGVVAWAAGAAFIPALALALGTLTGTPRAFEAIYIVWWYMGPLQPVPVLDFMGASREAVARGMPMIYSIGTLCLWLAAAFARRVRLRA